MEPDDTSYTSIMRGIRTAQGKGLSFQPEFCSKLG